MASWICSRPWISSSGWSGCCTFFKEWTHLLPPLSFCTSSFPSSPSLPVALFFLPMVTPAVQESGFYISILYLTTYFIGNKHCYIFTLSFSVHSLSSHCRFSYGWCLIWSSPSSSSQSHGEVGMYTLLPDTGYDGAAGRGSMGDDVASFAYHSQESPDRAGDHPAGFARAWNFISWEWDNIFPRKGTMQKLSGEK